VRALPGGNVTFLFTDIEGSTRLWETEPVRMAEALARHDRLCRDCVARHGGHLLKMIGDGMHAVFVDAAAAVAATVDLQRGMGAIAAECGLSFKMRCGLNAGTAQERDGDYFGSAVNRAARIMAAAHGGQILVSQSIVERARERQDSGVALVHLGRVRLRDLSAPGDVWQVTHPELPSAFPALRSLDSTPNNLPQQLTSFIGREREVAAVKEMLGRARLLTLTGAGGCGKTRLALQVAADLLDAYPDGVWLVELAALADPDLALTTIATVLGLKEERGRTLLQAVTDHVASRRLLLLLDNAEHLLDACAHTVEALLRHSTESVVLTSSREALGIAGELIYRVPSLSLPHPKEPATPENLLPCESVRLFVERAQLHALQFTVTQANAPAVASICNRLDGIPLAIELAAARVRSLSVDELNQRLDQRFRVLTGGSRTALPRQQTLRSTIDWSYDLLNATEQALLCRLAVFSGGCTLEAVERVCAGDGIDELAMLDVLTSLCDKSLLSVDERDGALRYRLLETVRQYARERLLERNGGDRWRDRHLAYFLAFAQQADALLRGPDQQGWLDRLETEHDNLRAALTWATAPGADAVAGLRLSIALLMFWYVRGHFAEACSLVAGSLATSQDAPAAVRAEAMGGLGAMTWQLGDYATARRHQEACLAIHRDLGDERAIASSLIDLGGVDFAEGDYASARARFEEALVIRRRTGSDLGVAGVLNNLGVVAKTSGDLDEARRCFEASLDLYRKADDAWGIALSLTALGGIARERGELDAATSLLEESLIIRRDLRHRKGIAETLEQLAAVRLALHEAERAARMLGAAERLREEIGAPLPPGDRALHERHVAEARGALADDAAFERAWQQGRAMSQEHAVDDAIRSKAS
jgi:predicted ATPase/class 3 adenylate cyclase